MAHYLQEIRQQRPKSMLQFAAEANQQGRRAALSALPTQENDPKEEERSLRRNGTACSVNAKRSPPMTSSNSLFGGSSSSGASLCLGRYGPELWETSCRGRTQMNSLKAKGKG
jgi:hypothetical protein